MQGKLKVYYQYVSLIVREIVTISSLKKDHCNRNKHDYIRKTGFDFLRADFDFFCPIFFLKIYKIQKIQKIKILSPKRFLKYFSAFTCQFL